MAQLPSGIHVAIQAGPLFELMENALEQGGVITRLLRIECIDDVKPYIEVLWFRETTDAVEVMIAPGGYPIPVGMEPVPSGHTLATIGAETATWSTEDQVEFAAYLGSQRMIAHLSALLAKVQEVKRVLANEGEFEVRLQALMWQTGCHPVQSGETEDPMYELLQVDDDIERDDCA